MLNFVLVRALTDIKYVMRQLQESQKCNGLSIVCLNEVKKQFLNSKNRFLEGSACLSGFVYYSSLIDLNRIT